MKRLAATVCLVLAAAPAHAQYFDGLPAASALATGNILPLCQGGTSGVPGTCKPTQTTLGAVLNLSGSTQYLPFSGGTLTGPLHMGANTLDGSAIAFTGGSISGLSSLSVTGAATLSGGGTAINIDLSASKATATGGTTAQTLADFTANTINTISRGVKCDGSDETSKIQQAITDATALLKRVLLQGTTGTTCVSSAITLPSGAFVEGGAGVTLQAKAGSTGTLFSASSVSNVTLRNLTIDGNKSGATGGAVIDLNAVTTASLRDLTITNPSRHILVENGSTGVILDRLVITNSGQHCIDVNNSSRGTIRSVTCDGQSQFGILFTNGAHDWNVYDEKCSNSGIECFAITYTGYKIGLYGADIDTTGDNCVSVTGNYNLISGVYGRNCQGNGITLYGSYNQVVGNRLLDNAQGNGGNVGWRAGIAVQQGFGGLGQHNVVEANFLDDDQVTPTQLVGAEVFVIGYSAWGSGQSITSGNYRYNSLNLYLATTSGTTGASAPTCTSGTCSDGAVTWQYVATFDTTQQPDWNQFKNNNVYRFGTNAFLDASSASRNDGVKCNIFGDARSNGQPTANNRCTGQGTAVGGQFIVGSGARSIVWGSNLTLPTGADDSLVIGNTHTIGAMPDVQATGKNVNTNSRQGVSCYSSGDISAIGDAQICRGTLGTTSSASGTAVRLTSNNGGAVAGHVWDIQDNNFYKMTLHLVGVDQTNPANWFSYDATATLTRGSGVGTTAYSLRGSATTDGAGTGISAPPTVSISADTTLGGLTPQVTPADNDTWKWVLGIDDVETTE